jgi:hypothetical protein
LKHEPPTSRQLSESIEQLYAIFSRYPRPKQIDACSCGCGAANHVPRLYSKALRELGPAELDYYAFSALTTMGNENDFRHFLPRIFELSSANELFTDAAVVFWHLSYAHWENWPRVEQNVIREYFWSLWADKIDLEPELDLYAFTPVIDWICSIAQAENLETYLEAWRNNDSIASIANLARLVWTIKEELLADKPAEAYWENVPTRWQELKIWLLSTLVQEKLSQVSVSEPDWLKSDIQRALRILEDVRIARLRPNASV